MLSDNKTTPELTLEKMTQNNTLIKKIKDIKPDIDEDSLKNISNVQDLKLKNLTQFDQSNDIIN